MNNKYQSEGAERSALAVPDQVSVAMAEIAENMGEGLLALAVGAGRKVMGQLIQADVAAVCGPRGKHDPERTAVAHGREGGVGHPGWAPGPGDPAQGPRGRRVPGSWRCRSMSCSAPPGCSGSWRWR